MKYRFTIPLLAGLGLAAWGTVLKIREVQEVTASHAIRGMTQK